MFFPKQSIYPVPINEQKTIPFTCYHYISKQKTPELLTSLAQGMLFQVINPENGHVAPIQYPCVYEDTDNQFLVFFNPENQLPIESMAIEHFEGLTENYSDYTIRVTTTLPTFFEKINILNFGFRDTEVECVKVLTHALLTEQQPSFKEATLLFFDEENVPLFATLNGDDQSVTQYRPELINVVNERLGEQLNLQRGIIQHVNTQWAIDALQLN